MPPIPPCPRAWAVLLCGCLAFLCSYAAGARSGRVPAHSDGLSGRMRNSFPSVDVATEGNTTQISVLCRSRPLFFGLGRTVRLKETTGAVSPKDEAWETTTGALSPEDSPTQPPTMKALSPEDGPTQPSTTEVLNPMESPSQPTEALSPKDSPEGALGSDVATLVRSAGPGQGVEVALGHLEGHVATQVVLDVEGCGQVALVEGLPAWPLGLSLAIKGSLHLGVSWWQGAQRLNQLSLRVSGGVGGLCTDLPPMLETLDVSHTPMETLDLGPACAPPTLLRLEAAHASVTRVSLCTPTLRALHLSWNQVGGGLQWAACEGGLASVQYLEADNNLLSVASTCGWTGLLSVDLRHNLLAGVDLTSCPPADLSNLTAAHNLLETPPTLPPTLLYLDLSFNRLKSIPVLNHALMEADLSHNRVVSIGKSKFKRARKLLHLNLAHNHLSELLERDFSGLRNLRTLDVSHNRLRHVAASSLAHLRSLRRLHLQRNHLTTLDARDLDALQGHAHVLVVVHHNPWQCSCHLLSALRKMHTCPGCQQQVELKCREDGSWVSSSRVVRSCLRATAAADDRAVVADESDEDFSEEDGDDRVGGEAEGREAVVVVPGIVVLLVAAVAVALGYRLYRRHRRAVVAGLAPFCAFCGRCRPDASDGGRRRDRRSSHLGEDSDTETEL